MSRQGSITDLPGPSQHMSLFEEKARGKEQRTSKTPRHVTRELEAQKEKEVLQGYQRVQELRPRMLDGEDAAVNEWLLEAEKLVEAFRETRRLFLSTRVIQQLPCTAINLTSYQQLQGFRGIFRGAGNKKTDELNEDKMASRLQLEIGISYAPSFSISFYGLF
jgi:general transcription factor 3C polypeptide 3 (transcription factor C subunit 4)